MYKILLVEDDVLMIRMYQRFFTFAGYTVEIAVDGMEGYEKAKSFSPNLILLDVMMPKMNGLQTLEKLKTDETTKQIPVFILSNLANKSDAEKALQVGAVKYLIKSEYEPKQLLEIINEYLNNNQGVANEVKATEESGFLTV
jgi:CheY-like chemotaxis protein